MNETSNPKNMTLVTPSERNGSKAIEHASEGWISGLEQNGQVVGTTKAAFAKGCSTPRRRPSSPPANEKLAAQRATSLDRMPILEASMEVWVEERKAKQKSGKLKLASERTNVLLLPDRISWDAGKQKQDDGRRTCIELSSIIGSAVIDTPKPTCRIVNFFSACRAKCIYLWKKIKKDPGRFEPVETQHYYVQMSCAGILKRRKHFEKIKRHYFMVHFVGISPASPNHWYRKGVLFGCESADDARCWAQRLQSLASMQSGFRGERPQRLVIFINPYGGSKQAAKTWEEVSAPLFHHAQVDCKVITTEYAGHARKILESLSLQDFAGINGIVGLGGDGFLGEIINGIMTLRHRDEDHNEALKGMRFGIIPAGSTDTVVVSTLGTRSVETATLHVILGDRMDIDMVRLQAGEETRYVASFVGFGFFGEVISRSESLRWMGPLRYSIAGALSFLRHKSHQVKVCYRRSRTPRSTSVCYYQCPVCDRGRKNSANLRERSYSTPFSSVDSEMGMESASDSVDEQELLEEGLADWGMVDKKFLAVAGPILSCRCDQSPEGMSKHSHLSDGKITLIMVKMCSRLQFLRFLIRLSKKESDPLALPYVQAVETDQFRIQPREAERLWNCDGEKLSNGHSHVVEGTVCQGLVQMFARGPLQEE